MGTRTRTSSSSSSSSQHRACYTFIFKSDDRTEKFIDQFTSFIQQLITYLNLDRHTQPYDFFRNTYVRVVLNFQRDRIDYVIELIVRKSDCYVVAIGTHGRLWQFRNVGVNYAIDGANDIGFGGSYDDLGLADLKIDHNSFYDAVIKISTQNVGDVNQHVRDGWRKSIALLIVMTSESARLIPVFQQVSSTLAVYKKVSYTIVSGDWMHRIETEWSTLSLLAGQADPTVEPIPHPISDFNVGLQLIMDPNNIERFARAAACISVRHLPAPV